MEGFIIVYPDGTVAREYNADARAATQECLPVFDTREEAQRVLDRWTENGSDTTECKVVTVSITCEDITLKW